MWRRLALVGSLAAALAPLKSFGKTKGRGIRIQDKKGTVSYTHLTLPTNC